MEGTEKHLPTSQSFVKIASPISIHRLSAHDGLNALDSNSIAYHQRENSIEYHQLSRPENECQFSSASHHSTSPHLSISSIPRNDKKSESIPEPSCSYMTNNHDESHEKEIKSQHVDSFMDGPTNNGLSSTSQKNGSPPASPIIAIDQLSSSLNTHSNSFMKGSNDDLHSKNQGSLPSRHHLSPSISPVFESKNQSTSSDKLTMETLDLEALSLNVRKLKQLAERNMSKCTSSNQPIATNTTNEANVNNDSVNLDHFSFPYEDDSTNGIKSVETNGHRDELNTFLYHFHSDGQNYTEFDTKSVDPTSPIKINILKWILKYTNLGSDVVKSLDQAIRQVDIAGGYSPYSFIVYMLSFDNNLSVVRLVFQLITILLSYLVPVRRHQLWKQILRTPFQINLYLLMKNVSELDHVFDIYTFQTFYISYFQFYSLQTIGYKCDIDRANHSPLSFGELTSDQVESSDFNLNIPLLSNTHLDYLWQNCSVLSLRCLQHMSKHHPDIFTQLLKENEAGSTNCNCYSLPYVATRIATLLIDLMNEQLKEYLQTESLEIQSKSPSNDDNHPPQPHPQKTQFVVKPNHATPEVSNASHLTRNSDAELINPLRSSSKPFLDYSNRRGHSRSKSEIESRDRRHTIFGSSINPLSSTNVPQNGARSKWLNSSHHPHSLNHNILETGEKDTSIRCYPSLDISMKSSSSHANSIKSLPSLISDKNTNIFPLIPMHGPIFLFFTQPEAIGRLFVIVLILFDLLWKSTCHSKALLSRPNPPSYYTRFIHQLLIKIKVVFLRAMSTSVNIDQVLQKLPLQELVNLQPYKPSFYLPIEPSELERDCIKMLIREFDPVKKNHLHLGGDGNPRQNDVHGEWKRTGFDHGSKFVRDIGQHIEPAHGSKIQIPPSSPTLSTTSLPCSAPSISSGSSHSRRRINWINSEKSLFVDKFKKNKGDSHTISSNNLEVPSFNTSPILTPKATSNNYTSYPTAHVNNLYKSQSSLTSMSSHGAIHSNPSFSRLQFYLPPVLHSTKSYLSSQPHKFNQSDGLLEKNIHSVEYGGSNTREARFKLDPCPDGLSNMTPSSSSTSSITNSTMTNSYLQRNINYFPCPVFNLSTLYRQPSTFLLAFLFHETGYSLSSYAKLPSNDLNIIANDLHLINAIISQVNFDWLVVDWRFTLFILRNIASHHSPWASCKQALLKSTYFLEKQLNEDAFGPSKLTQALQALAIENVELVSMAFKPLVRMLRSNRYMNTPIIMINKLFESKREYEERKEYLENLMAVEALSIIKSKVWSLSQLSNHELLKFQTNLLTFNNLQYAANHVGLTYEQFMIDCWQTLFPTIPLTQFNDFQYQLLGFKEDMTLQQAKPNWLALMSFRHLLKSYPSICQKIILSPRPDALNLGEMGFQLTASLLKLFTSGQVLMPLLFDNNENCFSTIYTIVYLWIIQQWLSLPQKLTNTNTANGTSSNHHNSISHCHFNSLATSMTNLSANAPSNLSILSSSSLGCGNTTTSPSTNHVSSTSNGPLHSTTSGGGSHLSNFVTIKPKQLAVNANAWVAQAEAHVSFVICKHKPVSRDEFFDKMAISIEHIESRSQLSFRRSIKKDGSSMETIPSSRLLTINNNTISNTAMPTSNMNNSPSTISTSTITTPTVGSSLCHSNLNSATSMSPNGSNLTTPDNSHYKMPSKVSIIHPTPQHERPPPPPPRVQNFYAVDWVDAYVAQYYDSLQLNSDNGEMLFTVVKEEDRHIVNETSGDDDSIHEASGSFSRTNPIEPHHDTTIFNRSLSIDTLHDLSTRISPKMDQSHLTSNTPTCPQAIASISRFSFRKRFDLSFRRSTSSNLSFSSMFSASHKSPFVEYYPSRQTVNSSSTGESPTGSKSILFGSKTSNISSPTYNPPTHSHSSGNSNINKLNTDRMSSDDVPFPIIVSYQEKLPTDEKTLRELLKQRKSEAKEQKEYLKTILGKKFF